MLAPFEQTGAENPYAVHSDLENCMQNLVGIIRTESELAQALDEIEQLKERIVRARVEGNRYFNPGWHMALDMHTMLTVSEAITRAALARKESRGQWQAAAHVHDAHEHLCRRRADHGLADAHVSADQGPGHQRLVQLRESQDHPRVQAPRARSGRYAADVPGRCGPGPGVPQVHRVLLVPGRLPRHSRPREQQEEFCWSTILRATRGAGNASAG